MDAVLFNWPYYPHVLPNPMYCKSANVHGGFKYL